MYKLLKDAIENLILVSKNSYQAGHARETGITNTPTYLKPYSVFTSYRLENGNG